VDVDLELGEGDDEQDNSFFDMRGEGFYKGSGKGDGKDKDKEGKSFTSAGTDRPGGAGGGKPRTSGDSRLR
jgi:hypothetical protein